MAKAPQAIITYLYDKKILLHKTVHVFSLKCCQYFSAFHCLVSLYASWLAVLVFFFKSFFYCFVMHPKHRGKFLLCENLLGSKTLILFLTLKICLLQPENPSMHESNESKSKTLKTVGRKIKRTRWKKLQKCSMLHIHLSHRWCSINILLL